MENLVKMLKPLVTFSAVIEQHKTHGDEVCVGGIIKNIYDFTNILSDLPVAKKGDIRPTVSIEIDDSLGMIELVLPQEVWENCNQVTRFTPGMVVLAEGKVWDDTPASKKPAKKVVKHPENPYAKSVLCWKLWPLMTSPPKKDEGMILPTKEEDFG